MCPIIYYQDNVSHKIKVSINTQKTLLIPKILEISKEIVNLEDNCQCGSLSIDDFARFGIYKLQIFFKRWDLFGHSLNHR